MTTKQFKKFLDSFVEDVNCTFNSNYFVEESDLVFRLVTRDSYLTVYRLNLMPRRLLSFANFSVANGCIVVDFFKSDIR